MPAAPGVEFDWIIVGQDQINSAAAELTDVALRPTKTSDCMDKIRGSSDRRGAEDAINLGSSLEVGYDFVQRRSCSSLDALAARSEANAMARV